MQHLATVMDRLESGSEEAIREHLDRALGLWAAAHDSATKVLAVSEQSVAFVDEQENLWVGRHATDGERIALTDVKKILNIAEESVNYDCLDAVCEQFVQLVGENREDDAASLIGVVLEYKQKVVRAGRLKRINDPQTRKRNFRKMDYAGRWNIMQAAKRTGKRTAHRASKALRQQRSQKRRKILNIAKSQGAAGHKTTKETIEGDEQLLKEYRVLEAMEQLPSLSASLIAALDYQRRVPVLEGTATLFSRHGIPSILATGDNTIRLADDEDQDEKKDDDSVEEGEINERTYSTGLKVQVAGMKDKDGKDVPEGEYEVGKANSRTCHLLDRATTGEGGAPQGYKVSTTALKKAAKKVGKKAVSETIDEAITMCEGDRKGCVVINLSSLNESFNTKDFMYRSALAWEQFRSDPVSEEVSELLKEEELDPAKICEACSFFLLLNEDEIYEAIAPHMDAFDPNAIAAKAKTIAEHAETDEAKQQIEEFALAFGDEEIADSLRDSSIPISETLDSLLLEAPKFDFGGAADIDSDSLDDDEDTETLDDDEIEGDDLDDEDDDFDDMEEDTETATVELDVAELREKLTSVLDVIGQEIEDNEEFEELRDRIEDEESDIDGETITSLLSVIDDYFEAVGKKSDREEEEQEEESREGETLDDMEDLDDTEGDATGAGGADDDEDLNLGQ